MMEVHFDRSTPPMTDTYAEFEVHVLEDGHRFFVGRLPGKLGPDSAGFEVFWELHPSDYHVIQMHGRPVKTPRWQQAYGADYHIDGLFQSLDFPDAEVFFCPAFFPSSQADRLLEDGPWGW
jgi:hypothetical protein